MKFSAREDIEAPLDYVFERVSDFDGFERRAMRHGAEVERTTPGEVGQGTQWKLAFPFRGRTRTAEPTVTAYDPPSGFHIETVGGGMRAQTEVTLVSLSPGRTRLSVAIELRAESLTSRLLLQSMKLAKGKLTKRFKARVLDFAEDTEDAYISSVS